MFGHFEHVLHALEGFFGGVEFIFGVHLFCFWVWGVGLVDVACDFLGHVFLA